MHKSSGIAGCIVSVSSLIQILSSIVCIVLYGATCFTVFCISNQCLITVFKFHYDSLVHYFKVNNDSGGQSHVIIVFNSTIDCGGLDEGWV